MLLGSFNFVLNFSLRINSCGNEERFKGIIFWMKGNKGVNDIPHSLLSDNFAYKRNDCMHHLILIHLDYNNYKVTFLSNTSAFEFIACLQLKPYFQNGHVIIKA